MSTVTVIPASNTTLSMLRVAAYCRVSSNSADQIHSYQAQITTYTNLIASHPDWKLVDIYADEGISGTDMKKRDSFNRMIAACKRGRIDMILTKSLSRFARNTVDCISKKVRKNNGELKTRLQSEPLWVRQQSCFSIFA